MTVLKDIYAGLSAGAVAAIIAVFVSIPLESPDDIRLNSATVGLAALFVGTVSGGLWRLSGSVYEATRRFWLYSAMLGIVILFAAVLAESQLDDALIFTIPLAIIVAICSIFFTSVFATKAQYGNWSGIALVIVAVVLSIALAGLGDQKSGELALPPPP